LPAQLIGCSKEVWDGIRKFLPPDIPGGGGGVGFDPADILANAKGSFCSNPGGVFEDPAKGVGRMLCRWLGILPEKDPKKCETCCEDKYGIPPFKKDIPKENAKC
jgi:hypothetical protein